MDLLAHLFQDRSVSRSQAGNRHTEGRAAHVVQANLMAEHQWYSGRRRARRRCPA